MPTDEEAPESALFVSFDCLSNQDAATGLAGVRPVRRPGVGEGEAERQVQ